MHMGKERLGNWGSTKVEDGPYHGPRERLGFRMRKGFARWDQRRGARGWRGPGGESAGQDGVKKLPGSTACFRV